jgi:hypothetical protein
MTRPVWPFIAALVLAGPAIAHATDACNRACLENVAHAYWSALLAHDPARLPQAANLRFTENNVPLPLGRGLWQTVSRAEGAITIVEEDRSEVATMARIAEGTHSGLAVARLKIEQGRVRELETLVARTETASFLRPGEWDGSPMLQVLDPAAQVARNTLIQVAEQYFDRLPDPTQPTPPLDPDCNRIENGLRTTNNPDPFPGVTPSPLNPAVSRLGCAEQFASHSLSFVSRVRERRYPLVDVNRGLVLSLSLFDHDGTLPAAPGTSVKLSAPLPSPYSYLVAELFKMRAGRIVLVQAFMTLVPYGMASAWP